MPNAISAPTVSEESKMKLNQTASRANNLMKRINGNISSAISVITRQNSGDYINSKRVAASVLDGGN